MAKNTDEKLTELITAVLPPSMRAHLDHACQTRGQAAYAYLIREALGPFLNAIDPLTPAEKTRITKQWIADHPHTAKH